MPRILLPHQKPTIERYFSRLQRSLDRINEEFGLPRHIVSDSSLAFLSLSALEALLELDSDRAYTVERGDDTDG